MGNRTQLVLVIAAVFSAAGFAAADDLASAEKKLVEAWDKHTSISAKMTVVTHMEMGATVVDGKGDGMIEVLKKDGEKFVRIELNNKVTQKMGEKSLDIVQSQLTVIDDRFTYVLSDVGGRKSLTKSEADKRMTGSPKSSLDAFRKSHTLKLLPDETIDGAEVFVIEAVPGAKAGAGGRTVLYFQKDTGVMARRVQYGRDNKPVTTVAYSDITIDADINSGRFLFKAPKGVRMVDKTRGAQP